MKNPGLTVFAHPLDDPMEAPDHESGSDSYYTAPVGFGRWRNPGSSIRVPFHFEDSGQTGYGELLAPAEKDGADKIINGDHESDHPSANPYVEHARQDLKSPGSDISVHTLASLLSGSRADAMPADDMRAAHEWLSRRFSGVRVNPHHGFLQAASPAGVQTMRRHSTDLVVPTREAQPSYELTNKHGTFQSEDPDRLVRAMVAFQIMHNEAMLAQKKKDDDQDDGLQSTSASARDILWAGGEIARKVWDKAKHNPVSDYLNPALAPGARRPEPVPELPKPTPLSRIPEKAIFEPGAGHDVNDHGVRGGYVAHDVDAPAHWHRDPTGVAYSPGHEMNLRFDPEQARKPRDDPYFAGHTYTYAPNAETGHTVQRFGGGSLYWATPLHPAVRGGFDLPPRPKTPKPKRRPPAIGRTVIASNVNDLCPACNSGYLEPYDDQHHECLACGSLIKHEGFEKTAAPRPGDRLLGPRGPLGRGLSDISAPTSDPLGLASAGTDIPEDVDLVGDEDEDAGVHPLFFGTVDPDYVAPAKGQLLDKQSGMDDDPADLEKFLGKIGYRPMNKPGRLERSYYAPIPGVRGAYAWLQEGAGGSGWALTLNSNVLPTPEYMSPEDAGVRSVQMQRHNPDDLVGGGKEFRQKTYDMQNRAFGDQSFLATGHHPIDDDHLNRTLRDVAYNGRNSLAFKNLIMGHGSKPFELEDKHLPPGPGTQKHRRMLSSVNPGMARFTHIAD